MREEINLDLLLILKVIFLEDTIPKPKPKNVVKLNPRQQENIRKNNDIFYRSLNRSLQEMNQYIQAANYLK